MAVNLKSTLGLTTSGVKVLVYGPSGAGKTHIIKTLPSPIILSAEAGLLSLQKENLPYIEISDLSTLMEAYTWIMESEEARQFKSVALDSISEIAECVLNVEKKMQKDGRAAYGSMNDTMGEVIRHFRDIPNRHVYFSAKMEKTQDEMGRVLYGPSMPGSRLAQGLPYFFDEVLALRVERNSDGEVQRALMTDTDGLWTAKDRSGKLSFWEGVDLGMIIRKIGGEVDEERTDSDSTPV